MMLIICWVDFELTIPVQFLHKENPAISVFPWYLVIFSGDFLWDNADMS